VEGSECTTPFGQLSTSGHGDAQVDKSYSQPEECLLGGDGDLGGAYIVRLPCGDSNDYLRCAPALHETLQPVPGCACYALNVLCMQHPCCGRMLHLAAESALLLSAWRPAVRM
jgi:hypothetical protein